MALTILLIYLLELTGLPAARFLGPLIAALAFSVGGFRPTIPPSFFTFAKGMLGVRIAQSLGPDFFSILGGSWPFLACGTLWAMLSTAALGIILTRRKVMPGPTAIWGLSPGGASVMTLLSAEHGADMRMVALMQYTRVVLVSLVCIMVARLMLPGVSLPGVASQGLFPPFSPYDLLVTIVTALIALYISKKTNFPGGDIIFSMILVALVRNLAHVDTTLPPFILFPCYIIIGYRIGGNFSMADLKRGFRIYHWILISILAMIAFCGLFGYIMWAYGGFDSLTAYLSTSPGGLDVVTIIAAGTDAGLPFIAAMQTLRLFAVILLGPWLARLCMRVAGLELPVTRKQA
ncbi:MAG: AbrB family transcriptional regulator [Deltaproteobacteria bacterium]|nr:AbrB family transcriptional regulator [Deltaproteobacteria bacterium]